MPGPRRLTWPVRIGWTIVTLAASAAFIYFFLETISL